MISLSLCWRILSVLLLLPIDETCGQSTDFVIISPSNDFIVCRDFSGTEPSTCSSPNPLAMEFPGATGTPLKLQMLNCDSTFYFYILLDGGSSADQIYRRLVDDSSDTPLALLDSTTSGLMDITNFAICCDTLVFANDMDVYVQNIAETPILTKLLFSTTATIDHLEVSCDQNEYYVFHSINTNGLYRTGLDGSGTEMIVQYDGAEVILDMDFNGENGYFGFGVGANLYMWDYASAVTAGTSFPILFSSLTVWYNNAGSTINRLTVGTVVGSDPPQPNIITSGTSGANPLSYTSDSSTTVSIAAVTNTALDLYVCLDAADCTSGCNNCPCDQTDDYQDCCPGLCVSRNEVDDQSYSCFCRDDDVFMEESCSTNGATPTYPSSCPLDLIGAVKCHGSKRTETSFVYALSSFSRTYVCATDMTGKDQPFPRGAIPLAAATSHSSAYKFLDDRFLGGGEQYGVYTVRTSNPTQGLSSTKSDSIPVILQERIEAIYSKVITARAEVGDDVCLQVGVSRQCNTRRIRWKKNGVFLRTFKRETKLCIDNIELSDFGIYEAYLQGRYKQNWRFIIRLVRSLGDTGCDATCLSNGGVCTYNNLYCICPPGRVGPLCESTCTKGRFGLLGECGFSCQEEFGDDVDECQYILFCPQDPFGCQCYPGYKLPYCTPCPRGFWGTNCENTCSCASGTCDSYDGTCP